MVSWIPGGIYPCENEVDLMNSLTREQVAFNTTMLVDIPKGRLLQPQLKCSVITGYIESNLPLDHFLRRGPPIVPTHRMNQAIGLRHGKGHQELYQRTVLCKTAAPQA